MIKQILEVQIQMYSQSIKYNSEMSCDILDLPYELKYFLDDIGVRDAVVIVEQPTQNIKYDVWLPSNSSDEPPF